MGTSEYLDMLVIKSEIEKNVLDKYKIPTSVAKFLRTTSTYRECKSLYDNYVIEVAKFVRNAGVVSSIETVLYLDYMLRLGFLSCTGENKYRNYRYDNEFLFDILGSRTVGGASVCRHMSALVTDVMNVYHTAGWLSVKSGNSIELLKKTGSDDYDHAIVGIESDSKKILYDPTVSAFAGRAHDLENDPLCNERIGEVFQSFVRITSIYKYLWLNNERAKLKEESWNELQVVFNCPLMSIDVEEFREASSKVAEIYKKTFFEMCDFGKKMKEVTTRIGELDKELTPRSDEPIRKWLVRK